MKGGALKLVADAWGVSDQGRVPHGAPEVSPNNVMATRSHFSTWRICAALQSHLYRGHHFRPIRLELSRGAVRRCAAGACQ